MLADSVELPEGFGAWWSCVPHLVAAPGHEYLHAIGYLVANALHRRAVDGGTAAVAPIIELLRAGASDTPERLLRRAGLDLDDPSFWQQQVDAVDALVAEAEALAGERAMRRRQSASASSAGTYRA
jgi:oligoendopeptidase F